MYILKLRGAAPDGSVHYTYYKRLKGITDDAITDKCVKMAKDLDTNYDEWSLFQDLALKTQSNLTWGVIIE